MPGNGVGDGKIALFFGTFLAWEGLGLGLVIWLYVEMTMLMRFLGLDKTAKQVEESTPKKGYYDPVRNGTL